MRYPILYQFLYLIEAFSLLWAVSGQQAAVFGNEVGPLQLDTEGPLVPDNYSQYHPLFNDYGFVIRGNTSDGQDFSLWMFMYRQTGSEEVILDADVYQIAFIHGHFSADEGERQQMHDTPFVNTGQNIEDYYDVGTLQSTGNASTVAYSIANTTLSYDGDTQTWRAYGTHAGVTVDITMTSVADEFLHAGSFANLAGCAANTTATNYNCSGIAGGIIHATATGTIAYNGTTTTLDQAYAVHERIIQARTVASRIQNAWGNGAYWLHAWGRHFSFWSFDADLGSYASGMLTIGNRTYVTSGANNPNVTRSQTDEWLDPKSHQLVGTAWRVSIATDLGLLESQVTGFGRLYYYWVRKGGLIITTQVIADAESTLTFKNGSVLHDHQFAFVEAFRTMYIATPLPWTIGED
ncbi:hypothetical protein A1O3_03126 [Capronia epimyces CBS 606.96]|uniref:Uncharacterized protein n=1 Tax=Capronia epimyces CBS 606.96 TaxID=1182542 RepID=W9YC10_9EURO|nr:uncharacterized protein A1O3_03126 [Capronia epimyces CBS 606.96]EXJ90058.1 hypothetical protein A1O3_03126 [Capronia epimyces CBS 606.96]